MIYSSLVAIFSTLGLICASAISEVVLTDADRFPMAHANAIMYALYHFAPLRNGVFSSPLLAEEEPGEESSSAMTALQLLFAKIHGGGSVNLVFLLENSYLAAEGFEASPVRLPRFIDPNRFFSWSIGRLAETDAFVKQMFSWKVEEFRSFQNAQAPHFESEREMISFDIKLSDAQPVHGLQAHLDSLIRGVESFVVQQSQKQDAMERIVVHQTRFTHLPHILTFRILKSSSESQLSVPETLNLQSHTFQLYALISYSKTGNFVTFVRVDDHWKQFESDKAPLIVSFEEVQRAFPDAYMLFYAKPSFMQVVSVAEPSIDLQLKSCASERLYQVGLTLQRSRSGTPTPPPSTSVSKSRRLASEHRHFDFAGKRSPANISPLSSTTGLPPLHSKQAPADPKSFDMAELLVTAASKAVVLEEYTPEDECQEFQQRSGQEASDSLDSDLQADLTAYNMIARSTSANAIAEALGHMRRPRQDNYLFDWSANDILPPSISLPSQLSDPELAARHQQMMRPLRRHQQFGDQSRNHK